MQPGTGNKPERLTVTDEAGIRFVEGPPDRQLMRVVDDAALLVEACLNAKARSALLYAQNLPGRFFDLSSGEAGEVLQKLRNYRIRLAVVCAPDSVRFSTRFPEMAAEESRAGYFHLFESRQAACAWLRAAAALAQ